MDITILKCYLSFFLYDIVPLDLPPVTSEAKPSAPPSSRRNHDDDTSGADGLSQLPFQEYRIFLECSRTVDSPSGFTYIPKTL